MTNKHDYDKVYPSTLDVIQRYAYWVHVSDLADVELQHALLILASTKDYELGTLQASVIAYLTQMMSLRPLNDYVEKHLAVTINEEITAVMALTRHNLADRLGLNKPVSMEFLVDHLRSYVSRNIAPALTKVKK
jgi:hypothetical protein